MHDIRQDTYRVLIWVGILAGLVFGGFMLQVHEGLFMDEGLAPLSIVDALISTVIILTMPGALLLWRDGKANVIDLVLAILLMLLAVNQLLGLDERLFDHDLLIDDAMAALWMAGGLLLWMHLRRDNKGSVGKTLVVLGLLTQFSIIILHAALLVRGTEEVAWIEMTDSIAKALALALYAGAALSCLASNPAQAQQAPLVRLGNWLSRTFFRLEHGRLGARASIIANNLAYRLWRLFHPGKQFKDFYAWQISRKLERGRAHRTLGQRRFDQDNLFVPAPEQDASTLRRKSSNACLSTLQELGLREEHVLVDYGCGSLRNGFPLMSMLRPGHYWGLDVTDRFYEAGLKMLPPALVAARQPHLHIISPEALEEARRARPDFIISIAVAKHVPENELDAYFDNLCHMMHAGTTLLLSFTEAAVERQISGKSWAWSRQRMMAMLRARLPRHIVGIQKELTATSRGGLSLKNCYLVATPKDAANARHGE